MSLKKKLFSLQNNNIIWEEKIVKINIKTGSNILLPTIEDIEHQILFKKFIKNKIYPSDIIVEGKPDTLYFENEKICKLLKNNKIIYNLRTPKLLLNSIDKLIEDIDDHLVTINYFIPKLNFIENNVRVLIEELRITNDISWFSLIDNLTNIGNLSNKISLTAYNDLIKIYSDIVQLKKGILNEDIILKLLFKFEKINKKYEEFNKPLEITSNFKKIQFKNDDEIYKIEKVYEYIRKEYNCIIDTYIEA